MRTYAPYGTPNRRRMYSFALAITHAFASNDTPPRRRIYPLALAAILALPVFLGAQEPTDRPKGQALPVERFALYVAANDGGPSREPLRYALSDAERLASTLSEIGGVSRENSVILDDPRKEDIDRAFARFATMIASTAGRAKRTEFIFYYSGHSDETALLLGSSKVTYAELKASLDLVPTDVHVVMLDSCHSGEFVRTKGGSRQRPFLIDDASVVKGHAYLSSSSATESSQESDMIQASYFTHSIVTGLRGAADASGDRKVSLNELYHYAFNDTLSRTEKSNYGPQHPSFNITLVGSGDLVLTDISEAESVLIFPKEAAGRYFLRTDSGALVSEMTKVAGTELALAIPAGSYALTHLTPTSTAQTTIRIAKGQRLTLDPASFSTVARSAGRARGDEEGEEPLAEEEIEWTPFAVAFVPGLEYPSGKTDNVNCSLGFVMAKNERINGAQASFLVGSVTKGFTGVQATGFLGTATDKDGEASRGAQLSGFINVFTGDFRGFQGSGFLNVSSGNIRGAQGAGFLNVSTGEITGVQASGFLNVANVVHGLQLGVINVAKENTGVSFGLLNFIWNGVMDVGIAMDSNGFFCLQYQGGTKAFYTTFMIGYDTDWKWDNDVQTVHLGFGVGTRLELTKRLSLDFELLTRAVLDLSDGNPYAQRIKDGDTIELDTDEQVRDFLNETVAGNIPSLRVSLNVSLLKHLAAFGALSADVRILDYNDAAFALGTHGTPWKVVEDHVWLYPTLTFGLKF